MSKKLFIATVLVILVTFTAGLFGCAISASTTPPTTPVNTSPAPTGTSTGSTPPAGGVPTPVPQPALPSITEVVAKVRPSVVAINVQITAYDIFDRPVQEQGAGSGWIVRSDGYIVTNNHVVESATDIVVTLNDGRTFPAAQVNTDPATDLAVVKINAQNLTALNIGNSADLNVGDWVVAIGNALGQGIGATKGIVSALGISLSESPGQTLHGLIQTDAAINPGNSGGPLVDMTGAVVGITSLKVSQVGVEGMGYAININEATPIINTLITGGSIVRPYLGITVYTVDQSVAAFYGLGVNKGVLVADVASGSPADNAGLHAGDVIIAIDGKAQTDDAALLDYINSLQVGQKIEITYYRGTIQNKVTITLTQTPKS